jgi:serine/threonine protein kinase
MSAEEADIFHGLLLSHANACQQNPDKDRKLIKSIGKSEREVLDNLQLHKPIRDLEPYSYKEYEIRLERTVFYAGKCRSDEIAKGCGQKKHKLEMFLISDQVIGRGNFGQVRKSWIYYIDTETKKAFSFAVVLKAFKHVGKSYDANNASDESFHEINENEIENIERAQANPFKPTFLIDRYAAKKTETLFADIEDSTSSYVNFAKDYLVTDYIHGEHIRIGSEQLNNDTNLHQLSGLLYRKIKALHAKNWIHNDIKFENFKCVFSQENVLVDIFLLDFGFLKSPNASLERIAGTPSYVDMTVPYFSKDKAFSENYQASWKDEYAYVVTIALSLLQPEIAQKKQKEILDNFKIVYKEGFIRKKIEDFYYVITRDELRESLRYKDVWAAVLTNLLGDYNKRLPLPIYPEEAFDLLKQKVIFLENHKDFKDKLEDKNPAFNRELSQIIDCIKKISIEASRDPIYYLVLSQQVEKCLMPYASLLYFEGEASRLLLDKFYETQFNEPLYEEIYASVLNELLYSYKNSDLPISQVLLDNIKEILIEAVSVSTVSEPQSDKIINNVIVKIHEKIPQLFSDGIDEIGKSIFLPDLNDYLRTKITQLKRDLTWDESVILKEKQRAIENAIHKKNIAKLTLKFNERKEKLRCFEEALYHVSQEKKLTLETFIKVLLILPAEDQGVLKCLLSPEVKTVDVSSCDTLLKGIENRIVFLDRYYDKEKHPEKKKSLKEKNQKNLAVYDQLLGLPETVRSHSAVSHHFVKEIPPLYLRKKSYASHFVKSVAFSVSALGLMAVLPVTVVFIAGFSPLILAATVVSIALGVGAAVLSSQHAAKMGAIQQENKHKEKACGLFSSKPVVRFNHSENAVVKAHPCISS